MIRAIGKIMRNKQTIITKPLTSWKSRVLCVHTRIIKSIGKDTNLKRLAAIYNGVVTHQIVKLIHSANPKSWPVGIIVFAHVVYPSVRPHFSNLEKQNNRQQCSLLAWLWVWSSGSLMTPVLWMYCFANC